MDVHAISLNKGGTTEGLTELAESVGLEFDDDIVLSYYEGPGSAMRDSERWCST